MTQPLCFPNLSPYLAIAIDYSVLLVRSIGGWRITLARDVRERRAFFAHMAKAAMPLPRALLAMEPWSDRLGFRTLEQFEVAALLITPPNSLGVSQELQTALSVL